MASSAVRPIVIIGAARSGTNMLRDSLVRLRAPTTWPCDELPYLWKIDHLDVPHDELAAEDVTDRTRETVRRWFARRARRDNTDVVVEKTCANTLRVPFVRSVLPTAQFIHIHRDGRDAALSAAKRWTGSRDLPYQLRKARWTPLQALPKALRDAYSSRSSAQPWWGPRPAGTPPAGPTLALAAWQWSRCVTAAVDGFARAGGDDAITVRYETFVRDPRHSLERVAEQLAIAASSSEIARATSHVHRGSVGAWQKERRQLEPHLEAMAGALRALGYDE